MTIIITRNLTREEASNSLGIDANHDIDNAIVSYTAKSIIFKSNNVATIEFETNILGIDKSGIRHIDCPYGENDNNQLLSSEIFVERFFGDVNRK